MNGLDGSATLSTLIAMLEIDISKYIYYLKTSIKFPLSYGRLWNRTGHYIFIL